MAFRFLTRSRLLTAGLISASVGGGYACHKYASPTQSPTSFHNDNKSLLSLSPLSNFISLPTPSISSPLSASSASSSSTSGSSSLWQTVRDQQAQLVLHAPREQYDSVSQVLGSFVHRYTWPVIGVCAANAAVFGAWNLPILFPNLRNGNRISEHMDKHWTTSPYGVFQRMRYHTLVTSMFSHSGLFHFLFNTMAFSSAGPLLVQVLSPAIFTGFYVGSGIISGLVGHATSIYFTGKAQSRSDAMFRPSLGASGAVLALFSFFANIAPESRFKLIFLPVEFDASTMIKGLVLFDLAGLIYNAHFGTSPLGHGAHLGGVLTGWLFFELCSRYHERTRRILEARRIRLGLSQRR